MSSSACEASQVRRRRTSPEYTSAEQSSIYPQELQPDALHHVVLLINRFATFCRFALFDSKVNDFERGLDFLTRFIFHLEGGTRTSLC